VEEELLTEKRIEDTRSLIESMKDSDVIDSYVEKSRQLGAKKEELAGNRSSLREFLIRSGHLSAQIASFQTILESRTKFMDRLNDCTNQAMIYGRLTKAFGRDGVQAIIIDNVVDELTRATNSWLSEFSSEPMHISFVTQKQGTKGEWKETFDIEINTRNGPQPWHSLSGGEKFIVSFAIRLSLGSIQARRMGGETQLLLLDEVSSSLDPYNIDIFVTIIRKHEKSMKVLVITHDPALKDEFDTIITVRRTHTGSEVEIE
jgi:exonuclease SbcC